MVPPPTPYLAAEKCQAGYGGMLIAMPIHEYVCGQCRLIQEHLSLAHEDILTECVQCSSKDVARQMTAGSFHLKGGGWAHDGYGGAPAGPDRGAKESRIRADIREQHRDREKENDRKARDLGLKRVGDYQEIGMYPERPIE